MIKNVVFDCGGVLNNWIPLDYSKTLGLDDTLAGELFNYIFHSPIWGKSDLGYYHTWKDMVEDFVNENPKLEKEIRLFFKNDWMSFYTPLKKGQNLLRKLKQEGYKIYLLSNFASDGFKYCEEHNDIYALLDGKVISGDYHVIKPDKKIFDILFDKYNLKPEECFFIDDRESNVLAARSFGMHSSVYKENPLDIYSLIKSI